MHRFYRWDFPHHCIKCVRMSISGHSGHLLFPPNKQPYCLWEGSVPFQDTTDHSVIQNWFVSAIIPPLSVASWRLKMCSDNHYPPAFTAPDIIRKAFPELPDGGTLRGGLKCSEATSGSFHLEIGSGRANFTYLFLPGLPKLWFIEAVIWVLSAHTKHCL